jgi:hypothetical protein
VLSSPEKRKKCFTREWNSVHMRRWHLLYHWTTETATVIVSRNRIWRENLSWGKIWEKLFRISDIQSTRDLYIVKMTQNPRSQNFLEYTDPEHSCKNIPLKVFFFLQGNIRVFCRVRPLLGEEIEKYRKFRLHALECSLRF